MSKTKKKKGRPRLSEEEKAEQKVYMSRVKLKEQERIKGLHREVIFGDYPDVYV